LIPEAPLPGSKRAPDGTLQDEYYRRRGYWESKDPGDILEREMEKKFQLGYPKDNIIFEDGERAILVRHGHEIMLADLADAKQTAALLTEFFSFAPPYVEEFKDAVKAFKNDVPELGKQLARIVHDAYRTNNGYKEAFEDFYDLCRKSLNPNLSRAAVEEMIVQHILTERLIRGVFDIDDFIQQNAIASEVEKVTDKLTGASFSKKSFLSPLEHFYVAIENNARTITDFREKQQFLNTVYERFFQGFAVKAADTHGIIYTPQVVVDFMCDSVSEVLDKEFGKTLASPDVNIIDPCTGTGNFIVNLMRRMTQSQLEHAYRERLLADEVMLLPYYVAALNIEYAYYERIGRYEPFEGLSLVDTLDLNEVPLRRQKAHKDFFMTERNTQRVQRQRDAKIFVVIGNPPYNTNQVNENDNNKNREYKVLDAQIGATYMRDSDAQNKNKLVDAYVRFFRWATDRLRGEDGIVCFITNNGFLRGVAFDGFRKHLAKDFDCIYHLDLRGNARTSGERRRQEGGNIFNDQIRVGVGVSLLVRNKAHKQRNILYHAVGDYERAESKTEYVRSLGNVVSVPWDELPGGETGDWFPAENSDAFSELLPLGTKEAKRGGRVTGGSVIFKLFSNGVKTNRDEVVQDFNRELLATRMQQFVDDYNIVVDRFKALKSKPKTRAEFDNWFDGSGINWSRDLKVDVKRGTKVSFESQKVRNSLYRPFQHFYLYFDSVLNEEVYRWYEFLPKCECERDNRMICVSGIGSAKPF
jgi:predicted helicase